jgi:glyoxylase-like metal-dependent hydrolase (beta-lactamase superfamily II)
MLRSVVSISSALLLSVSALVSAAEPAKVDPAKEVRLYALDCGHITFKDMGEFSDTGEWNGKPGNMSAPCFLIQHPKGWLLWDSGLGDAIAANKEGADPEPGVHVTVPVTLVDQLKQLKLTPADVTYIAFSHFHFDHTGNANLFGASTWLLNKKELAAAESQEPPFGVDPKLISAHKNAKSKDIVGDYDVFGDGSVTILAAPGHTPGHQCLEVKLAKSGTVVLSGDLYHQLRNRAERLIPAFNTERADTLASIDRIERIVKNTHARFVIQHAPEDFAALPKFPAYLN